VEKAVGGIVLAEEPELFAVAYEAQVEQPDLDVMVVAPVLLQYDWYWDQLVQYYGDRMPPERPGTFSARVEGVISYNLGVVPIYATHDERSYYKGLNLVAEDELFKIEF
jgi:hypothetical protein